MFMMKDVRFKWVNIAMHGGSSIMLGVCFAASGTAALCAFKKNRKEGQQPVNPSFRCFCKNSGMNESLILKH